MTISEELPLSDSHEWLVSWSIQGFGASPARAAAKIWRDIFGRTMAGSDDACIFTVTDSETNVSVNVDLSGLDLESLIE